MPTTSNFGWTTPADTDLVKDGAAAIRTLGNGVDTSFVDLKGGTTGQVLAKASGSDLDFSWVTTDDANAIQNAIVDAKGDLISASAADTPARLAVGSNGETLVADSSATTGLRWQTAANSNALINGAFEIWQRNTSVAGSSTNFTADRWQAYRAVAGSTFSRQNTSDTTNLPFIQYCVRVQRDSGNTATNGIYLGQNLESATSRRFAGQAVVISFYARKGADFSGASSGLNIQVKSGTGTDQNIFSGLTGEASVIDQTATLTTTWQRFQYTATVSASATQLAVFAQYAPVGTASTNDYFEITGIQLELGSVATGFKRSGGTLAGELAACQRYYQKSYNQGDAPATATTNGVIWNWVGTAGTGTLGTSVKLPVIMRTTPTLTIYDGAGNSGKVFRGAANKNAGSQTGSDGTITIFTTDATSTLEWYFHFVASAEL